MLYKIKDDTPSPLQIISMMVEPKSRLDLKKMIIVHPPQAETQELSRPVKVSTVKKWLVVSTICWTAFTMSFSSTAVFSMADDIANTLDMSRNMLFIVNGIVFVVMATTTPFWCLLSQFTGRSLAYCVAIVCLFAGSIGVVFSKDTASFFATRILAALSGTYLLVAGEAYIRDIFEPNQGAMAVRYMRVCALLGLPLGPCIAGLVETYSQWKVVYCMEAGMAILSLASFVALLPIINAETTRPNFQEMASVKVYSWLALVKQSGMLTVCLSSGLLGWLQFFLLVSAPHLLGPRFESLTRSASSLFFLSPALGFVLGGLMWKSENENATATFHSYLRHGIRIVFGIMPFAWLTYGWTLQFAVGGIACPLIAAFFCGIGNTVALATLDVYCDAVFPEQRMSVAVICNTFHYAFGAVAIASAITIIDRIGAGWAFNICAILAMLVGLLGLTLGGYFESMETKEAPHLKATEIV